LITTGLSAGAAGLIAPAASVLQPAEQARAAAAPSGASSTLTVAQLTNPLDLSPFGAQATDEVDILNHIVEPLTMLDRKGQLVALVAENWDMQSPTNWVVKIRKGLRFHDPAYGELTAEDVKATIEQAQQPSSPLKIKLPRVIQDGTAEVVDKYTLRWKPAPPGIGTLPFWMGLFYVSPRAYIQSEGQDTFKRRPIGTGPYRFDEWAANQRIVAERFDGYWGPKPVFQRIVWRIVLDPLTAINAVLAGEIDVFQFVPPDARAQIGTSGIARIVDSPSTRMLFVVINAAEPPLDNQMVRQALNYAVDKKTIVENLYRGQALALNAPMQALVPEINRSLRGYPYDPAKAQQLLKAGGYKGETIHLGAPIGRFTLGQELGEAVAGMLTKVGVNVQYQPTEWGSYWPPLGSGKAHGINLIGNGNTILLPEYVFSLWLLPGGQGEVYTRGRPADWEPGVERASLLPVGNLERKQLFDKLQAEVLAWAPWILLINDKDGYAINNRVDWQPYPLELRIFRDAKLRR